MIGKITGRVDSRAKDHVLVDVQGVGYLVYCSERTLAGLPATPSGTARQHTHTQKHTHAHTHTHTGAANTTAHPSRRVG